MKNRAPKPFNATLMGVAFAIASGGYLLSAGPVDAATAYQFQEEAAEPQVSVTFGVKTATAGSMTVVFDYKDEQNFYALDLTPKTVALKSVVGGVTRALGTAAVKWSGSSQMTLKRRPWAMQVILDRRVVLTAYDATFNSGKIGSTATGGWGWHEVRVQPVEELYFTDDFTRQEGQEGEWKTVNGTWTLTSSSENINARNVSMSANPFSYQIATPNAKAFTQSGRWFWDNYHAEVSVKPTGRGTVGLAVYVQDPQNYLAFLWNAAEGPEARQLVRVVDGKPTVLAHAGGAFLPRQWYRVGVRTSPGYIETFIDGDAVFKVRDDWFGQGGIGLLAQNISLAAFDDVRVQSYSYYHQDFDGPVEGSWTADGGTWNAKSGILTSAPKAGDNGASRVLLSGGSTWNGYQLLASGRTGANGACGVVVGYHDNKNYSVFRWASASSTLPFHGRQQLLRYYQGKASIISDQPLKLSGATEDDGFASVMLRLTPGALAVYNNGRPIASMADEKLTSGRVGLWSQGSQPVSFRDVVVFFPPEPVAPKVPPKMEEDALMVGWASNSGEWPPTFGDDGTEFWNTGDFFGDSSLEMMWRRATYTRGKLEVALRAQRGDFNSGYVMRCESTPDKSGLHLTLLKGTKVLKESTFNWQELDGGDASKPAASNAIVPIKVDIESDTVTFNVAGRPALSYMDADAATAPIGTNLAVRTLRTSASSSSFALRTKELRAISTHRDDYTFNEAPTDWYSPQGNWSVISRWPCYSDWSFFGGKGVNPVLWSKRAYSGDIVVEMYAHNQMDLPKEVGYSHPGDLNITIGGDGKNPTSGYSFIVAGWDNTRTRIFKGTQQVAENTTEDARFPRPINHNMQFHRRWYYIRAEVRHAQKDGKPGVKVSLTVDDTVLGEYFDPTPLEALQQGGHVAFWTVDGTIMIARAKIESAHMGTRAIPTGLLDAAVQAPLPKTTTGDLAPRPVVADGLPSAVVERAEGGNEGGWTLRNPTAGGLFEVQLVKPGDNASEPWKVTPNTKLDFDVALPENVKVDLYATIDGMLHMVSLTNNQRPDARVRILGAAQKEAAAQGWQHVTFDLGAALKKMYPQASSWQVDQLSLGALHGDEYRWVGFDGNPLGATYRLKGMKLTGATQIAVAPKENETPAR